MSGDENVPAADPPVEFRHLPVMVERVVELFSAVPSGLIVDATVGGAGHASALLTSRDDITLLGIDQDADALTAAQRRLESFGDRVVLHRGRFDELGNIIRSSGTDTSRVSGKEGVMGVLFDLGVSSPQLDRKERGFSYRNEGPLDMRMDRRRAKSAATVVNEYSAGELADVLDKWGDERFARRIANAIVAERPIESTTELADVVRSAIPAAARRTGGHPAKRTFQAIRIEVNEELEILADALDQAIDALLPGGRCVALSYHSGEDRLVKERFRLAETGGCECPVGLDCVCGAEPKVRLLRRGAQKASSAEIDANPRAESVRLRAVEAIDLREDSRQGVAR